jgi:hydrogenase maturation protease
MASNKIHRATPDSPPRVIVVGLGNPILGDDGVGWRVADEVERQLADRAVAGRPALKVDVGRLGVGGLSLMEFLSGYDVAILVDAATFPDRPAGEVRASPFDELEDHAGGHFDSTHDASLRTSLDLGRRLDAELPTRIEAVTIQAFATGEFGEELTPAVEAAVPAAARVVMTLLHEVAD